MKYNRFHLEEAIVECYQTSTDINRIYEHHLDSPAGPLSEDDLINLFVGIMKLHELRCDRLMEIFEKMVKDDVFVSDNEQLELNLEKNS